MKILSAIFTMLLIGCATGSGTSGSGWVVGSFNSSIPHAPKLEGYQQLKSEAVAFRKYKFYGKQGLWTVSLDAGDPPIQIRIPGGKTVSLESEWYSEEGGADAATVYGFSKGGETLIVIQGTSDITHEETWVKIAGGKITDLHRYATKGGGMGQEMPGVAPEYLVYPPR
jgi:hypothetical protein